MRTTCASIGLATGGYREVGAICGEYHGSANPAESTCLEMIRNKGNSPDLKTNKSRYVDNRIPGSKKIRKNYQGSFCESTSVIPDCRWRLPSGR
jgi:hypothetical protein